MSTQRPSHDPALGRDQEVSVSQSLSPAPVGTAPAVRGRALFVPVRQGDGCIVPRFFRTAPGGRTAVGFTTCEQLLTVLGADQAWTRLSEPALRSMAAPLGVRELTVDPSLTAPVSRPVPPLGWLAPAPAAVPVALPVGAGA
jgi:hypothetical protein